LSKTKKKGFGKSLNSYFPAFISGHTVKFQPKYLIIGLYTGPHTIMLAQILTHIGSGGNMSITSNSIDTEFENDILRPEEVAQYLRKSTSWVYKNWRELGGRKLGGSLFFPRKENLYERLFGKGKGLEVRLQPGRNQAHEGLVQTKTGRPKSGHIEKGGVKKSGSDDKSAGNPNRHGILGSGQ